MTHRHATLLAEIQFLELLHEHLDVGETLYRAIYLSAEQAGRASPDFAFIHRALVHGELCGLAHAETLTTAAARMRAERLKTLFEIFASYEEHGSVESRDIQNLIGHRTRALYNDMERAIETAPFKLMGPLFVFIFTGSLLFLTAMLISAMAI